MLPKEDEGVQAQGCPELLAEAGAGEMVSLPKSGGFMTPSKGAAGGGQQAVHQRLLKGNWPDLFRDHAVYGREPECAAVLKERQAECVFQAGK